MSRRHFAGTVLTVALAAALAVPTAAHAGKVAPAGGADSIVASGPCIPLGFWTMTARAKKQGIGITVRIDAGRRGQVWRGLLTHNGQVVGKGVRPVTGRGIAMLNARTVNLPGVDTYTFTARNSMTRATCTGSLSY